VHLAFHRSDGKSNVLTAFSILKWSARGDENRHLVVQVEMLFGTAVTTNTRHWQINVPSPHSLDDIRIIN
jgi:hypothetical protein